jgi:hypothetical protein
MKIALLALGAGIYSAQSTIQTQTNGFWAGRPVAANVGGNGSILASTQVGQPAHQRAPGAVGMEQLGIRAIAGFEAGGTRTTSMIPAGQMGNQNPLAIVTERWCPLDFEATLLAERSHPRVGTSSYQFTTVQQIEIEEDGQ